MSPGEHANPGAKTDDAMRDVLKTIDANLKGPEDLLSPAMTVDARFLHSDGLLRRLSRPNSGWKLIHKTKLDTTELQWKESAGGTLWDSGGSGDGGGEPQWQSNPLNVH